MSGVPKKLRKGGQPPQNGWRVRSAREVRVASDADCPVIQLPVGMKKTLLTWQVDSAAANSVIDETSMLEYFSDVDIREIPDGLSFQSADGSPIHMVGLFSCVFWFGQIKISDDVYVCRGVTKTRLIFL